MKTAAIATTALGLILGYWFAPVHILSMQEDPGLRNLLRVRGTLIEGGGADWMTVRSATPFSDNPSPLVQIGYDERTVWLSASDGRYTVIPSPQVPPSTPLTAYVTALGGLPLTARYILVGSGI